MDSMTITLEVMREVSVPVQWRDRGMMPDERPLTTLKQLAKRLEKILGPKDTRVIIAIGVNGRHPCRERHSEAQLEIPLPDRPRAGRDFPDGTDPRRA